jgi:hypothetical protein
MKILIDKFYLNKAEQIFIEALKIQYPGRLTEFTHFFAFNIRANENVDKIAKYVINNGIPLEGVHEVDDNVDLDHYVIPKKDGK